MKDDLVSNLRVACVLDDAIDRKKTNARQYAKERDPQMVVPLRGAAVTWFHLRPISAPGMSAFVDASVSDGQRHMRAFTLAVDAIENLEAPGHTWRPMMMIPDPATGSAIAMMDDAELEHIKRVLGMPWIYEIGRVAYQRAAEGNTRGGGVSYTLPPTSHVELALIERRVAEEARLAALTDSNATSSAASLETPAAPSDSAGPVPAVAKKRSRRGDAPKLT